MDVRGSRDLEGAQVAMDADPRCVRALGMERLGSRDLDGAPARDGRRSLRDSCHQRPEHRDENMGIAPSYFPHPGRAGVAGPPNRLAPRSIAKVVVLLLEIAVFQ